MEFIIYFSYIIVLALILLLSVRIIKGLVEHLTKGKYSIRTYSFFLGIIFLFVYILTNSTILKIHTMSHQEIIINIIFIFFLCFTFISSIEKKK